MMMEIDSTVTRKVGIVLTFTLVLSMTMAIAAPASAASQSVVESPDTSASYTAADTPCGFVGNPIGGDAEAWPYPSPDPPEFDCNDGGGGGGTPITFDQ